MPTKDDIEPTPSLTEQIRRMKRGATEFFESPPKSVQRLISRVRAQHPRRRYRTEKRQTTDGGTGTRVWRRSDA